jgi:hypothetical protein
MSLATTSSILRNPSKWTIRPYLKLPRIFKLHFIQSRSFKYLGNISLTRGWVMNFSNVDCYKILSIPFICFIENIAIFLEIFAVVFWRYLLSCHKFFRGCHWFFLENSNLFCLNNKNSCCFSSFVPPHTLPSIILFLLCIPSFNLNSLFYLLTLFNSLSTFWFIDQMCHDNTQQELAMNMYNAT